MPTLQKWNSNTKLYCSSEHDRAVISTNFLLFRGVFVKLWKVPFYLIPGVMVAKHRQRVFKSFFTQCEKTHWCIRGASQKSDRSQKKEIHLLLWRARFYSTLTRGESIDRRRRTRRSRGSWAVCFPAGGESQDKVPGSHLKLNEGRRCRLLNESTHLAH